MVPLQGNKGKAIKEFFHKKTSDLHYLILFSKYKTLTLEAKKKNGKENNKTEDQG